MKSPNANYEILIQ